MENRFRLQIVVAVSAFILVAAFAMAVVPDATAKPCPPPTTNCPSCPGSEVLYDGTVCYLVDCLVCGKTICRYSCS